MPSINDVYKQQSDKLKAEDLGNNMHTVTISGVEFVEFSDNDKKLVLSFQETEKALVLNKTNATAIAEMYGDNYEMWPGSQIMIFSMMVDYAGKMVPGIRVRPPAGQQQQGTLTSQGQMPQPAPQAGWSQGGTGPGPGNPVPQGGITSGNPFLDPKAEFPGDRPPNPTGDEIPFK